MHIRGWASHDTDPYAPLRDKTIAGLAEATGFDDTRQHHVPWQHIYSRDQWLDPLPT